MPPSPSPSPSALLRLTQALAIALLTSTSGLTLSLSTLLIPRLLESPTPLLTLQFQRTLQRTRRLLTLLALVPSFAHIYLAYLLPSKARAYAIAAAVSLSAMPWGFVAMGTMERQMEGRARWVDVKARGGDDGGEEVFVEGFIEEEGLGEVIAEGAPTAHAIVDAWAVRNLYRPVAAFAAGCIGLYAALS